MWGESVQRGGEFGGGRRVSADREQSFPSASLVNYIVRDPISAFTVHWTPPFLSTSSVCDLCDNIDVCSPHGHAEYRDLFLFLTAFLINFYQFPYTVMTFCRNIFIGNSEDKKISGNSWYKSSILADILYVNLLIKIKCHYIWNLKCMCLVQNHFSLWR